VFYVPQKTVADHVVVKGSFDGRDVQEKSGYSRRVLDKELAGGAIRRNEIEDSEQLTLRWVRDLQESRA